MAPDPSVLLAPIVRERARILTPAVLGCQVFFIIAARPLGIQPPPGAHLASILISIALAVLAVAILMRKIPLRWMHVASTSVLWSVGLVTAISMYSTGNNIYAALFIVQVASSGVLMNRRLAIGTALGITAVAIALLIEIDGAYTGMLSTAVLAAAMFAVLIHFLMQRALVKVELSRHTEAETAHQLALRIAELERAQTERLQLQDQLFHAQRMEAIGTLAAGLAHDMNNVLAAITGVASLMLEEPGQPNSADLTEILRSAERGASLTKGLLAFSRRGQYRRQVVRIADVIRDVVPLLVRTLPKSIEIREGSTLAGACVEGDPVHLGQVLINLGLNAADAMKGTGTLTIESSQHERHARLRVTDTGSGMDEATRQRIFEPFFTTKPLGRGTGLGLSTVWGIVHAHDGIVAVESEVGRGTTFTIDLPIVDAVPVEPPVRAPLPPVERSTVLIVDDERIVRDSARRLLERMGLDILTAENGAEGVASFIANQAAIRLVILDMGMPVMGGAECFARIRERDTNVPILISTGYATDSEAQALVAAGAAIIEKPYPAALLRAEVSRLLNVG